MKVLLVKPYNISDHIQPPLGLGYLATSIRGRHEVKIVDCIKEHIKPADFPRILDKTKPDVVGIQCYTYDLYNVKEILRQCKECRTETVLGGPHPSAVPAETLEFFKDDLDYAFQGEAEIGFSMLLDKLSGSEEFGFKEIPGLVWREKGKVSLNDRCFLNEIDNLGMPAWDLIQPQTYPESQHGAFYRNFPIAPVIITRGCPFSCTFCGGNLISGKKLRKRSVESVISEIRMLYNDFGIREFHVVDDNFTLDKIFVKNFLTALKNEKLGISWAVPNGIRMDTLDDEILDLMKDTGLYLISLGIESGSDRVLELMKKNMTVKKIRQAVNMIRRHRIDIAGFFILGFPGETPEEIRKTIRFSLELDLVRANFFTYLPFPGTESYDNLKREGRLNGIDLKRFYFMNAAFSPDGVDKDTLMSLQKRAFLKFFLRPRVLMYNLMQIKSFRHFKFLLGRFFRWMF